MSMMTKQKSASATHGRYERVKDMGFPFTVVVKGQTDDLDALESIETILREMLPYMVDNLIIAAEPDGE